MSKKKILFCLLIFFSGRVFSAALVTHVHLTQVYHNYCGKYKTEKEKKLFFIGALFPDIRYTGCVSREQTHELGVTLEDIQKIEDPFIAGKKLHSFIDEEREKFIAQKGMYKFLEELLEDETLHKECCSILKFIEDIVLLKKTDLTTALSALERVHDQELSSLPGDSDIVKIVYNTVWHNLMRNWFSNGIYGILQTFVWFGLDKHSKTILALTQDGGIQKYVNNMVEYFGRLFKKSCAS